MIHIENNLRNDSRMNIIPPKNKYGIIPKLPEPPEPDIVYEGFFTTKIINKPPLAHRLKSAFKKVNYLPIKGAQGKVNLYNQFSESALNEIIKQLIQLGVSI